MLALLAFTLAAFLAPQAPATTTGILSGRVIEEGSGSTPVPGAQVVLRALGQPTFPRTPVTIDTTTDAAGRFTFSALAPGRYMLTLAKNGFATQQGTGPGSPQPLEITAGNTTTNERTLARSAVIVGRVTDESGEPRADARVMALHRLKVDPAIQARFADRPELLQNFNQLMPATQ